MSVDGDQKLDGLTPEDLAQRAQHGSLDAFARLVEIFETRLFNFILRRVGKRQDAEDLTQEAFLRAWQKIENYQSRWKFSTWLYTIATRLAISYGRDRVRLAALGNEEIETPAPAAMSNEGRGWIWRVVDDVLTAEQRTAVWLRYVEDMAIGDIATVMGKSQVAVRVMLFRARSELAGHLRPETDQGTDVEVRKPTVEVRTARARPIAGGVR